jgi:hypothetical protein
MKRHHMTAVHDLPYTSAIPFEYERIGAACCSDGRYGEHMDDFLHTASAFLAMTRWLFSVARLALLAMRERNPSQIAHDNE